MKIHLLIGSVISAGLLAGNVAVAQSGSASGGGAAPATRAAPVGEASVMPPATSVRSRAEVLAECLSAQKAGTIPQGECPEYGQTTAAAGTTPTRAEVMAECRVAQKAGLIPQGECPEYGTATGTTGVAAGQARPGGTGTSPAR
jgi:hypothetical protein